MSSAYSDSPHAKSFLFRAAELAPAASRLPVEKAPMSEKLACGELREERAKSPPKAPPPRSDYDRDDLESELR